MLAKKKSGEEKNWMNIFFGQKNSWTKKIYAKKLAGGVWQVTCGSQ